MSEWISCKDRQPPRKQVILYFPEIGGQNSSNNLSAMIKVGYARTYGHRDATHWMPLPPPPGESDES